MTSIPWNRINTGLLLLVLLAIVGLFASRAYGGPLDPPGPVAPTMKTLQQVEPRTPIASIPFTITTPGSYYLTGDLAATGTLGIRINADDVTIDLGGFTLSTTSTTLVLADGAIASSGHSRLAIRNGRITVFAIGINLRSGGHDVVIDHIQEEGPSIGFTDSTGMYVSPSEALISNCVVRGYPVGITTSNFAQVSNCTATNNATWGFLLGSSNILRDCVSTGNGNGISVADSSTVANCVVTGNPGGGITAGSGAHITGNSVSNNLGTGIAAQGGSLVADNNVTSNSLRGIEITGSGSRIDNNNLTRNGREGILLTGSPNIARRNTALENGLSCVPFFCDAYSQSGGSTMAVEAGSSTNPWANVMY